MSPAQPLRGVIFDMDGTLVDSRFDFDGLRAEMDIADGEPILEAIANFDEARAAQCREILARHERQAIESISLFPGVLELLDELGRRGLHRALLTRNSRWSVETVLSRLSLHGHFHPVLTREDGPFKPDPWAIHHICEHWDVEPGEVALIGDYVFDIEAGRRAGTVTVLFSRDRELDHLPWAAQADHVLDSFEQAVELIERLVEPA